MCKSWIKGSCNYKKEISTSSTNWAQGGIAGVLDTDNKEALEMHVRDTLECGGGYCDEEVVRSVVNEAADRINDLIKHGVRFDIGIKGEYDLNKEGGHSDYRILHSKDRTGAEIERALTEDAHAEIDENFKILENWMAVDLIQKRTWRYQKRSLWSLVFRSRGTSAYSSCNKYCFGYRRIRNTVQKNYESYCSNWRWSCYGQ